MIKIFLALAILTLAMVSNQALAVECDKPIHKSDGLTLVNPFQSSFGKAPVGSNNEPMFSFVYYKNATYADAHNFSTQGLNLNDVRALADEARFKGQMLFMTDNDFGVASEKIVDLCK
jgi:hypothetical protein